MERQIREPKRKQKKEKRNRRGTEMGSGRKARIQRGRTTKRANKRDRKSNINEQKAMKIK